MTHIMLLRARRQIVTGSVSSSVPAAPSRGSSMPIRLGSKEPEPIDYPASDDPVVPGNSLTYTNLNVVNAGTLRFQSITIPSGWSCHTLPSAGGVPNFTCTRASWAPGASQFIVVLRADSAVLAVGA